MNPTATLALVRPALDRDWLWLSESLVANLCVDGPVPLVVNVSKDWLRSDSAQAWKVTPLGNPKETRTPDGRAIWRQELRLDPYVHGEAVPIAFAPLAVRAGSGGTLLDLPVHTIAVKTRFADAKVTDARPVTGYEDPPAAPAMGIEWPLFVLAGALVVGLLVTVARRRRVPHAVEPTLADRLALLESQSESITGPAFAEELARILRRHLETVHGLPADRLTTEELARDPATEPVRELLEWCDRVRFGGADAGDRAKRLAETRGRVVPGSENRLEKPG
jgi:hypothetical protein